MSTPFKRRQYSELQDLMLLRQISDDKPFLARHGRIMEAWESVARALAAQVDFDRPHFDGKKAQSRFTILLRDHRDNNSAPMRAVSACTGEDSAEKMDLLEDISRLERSSTLAASGSQVDEAKEANDVPRSTTDDRDDAVETAAAAAHVNEEAQASVQDVPRKRKLDDDDDGDSNASGKLLKLVGLMNEASKHERDLRRFMFEREVEERKRDRDAQTQQIQMLQNSLTAVLDALIKKL
ncbi:hypothetical protein DYB26_009595 [Aphanomyces astaci]|uniref:Myb/SANT-like domain-containing protein n=2 Tax=Aphanomyces astaci TaxID=112090 RepID=A0A397CGM8_APHAT|nr:hypothetical protein DYB38_010849 [Aphanomyces astaci]RHY76030.1 hypothetical protein DYB34_014256 [Aphanomyces astaci]RHZ10312.1 hypothetical protein DYB26_009595 [Aphanomyces astaci]